jgi:CO dehydrogenase/acetyl-CoA synthase beta subunit
MAAAATVLSVTSDVTSLAISPDEDDEPEDEEDEEDEEEEEEEEVEEEPDEEEEPDFKAAAAAIPAATAPLSSFFLPLTSTVVEDSFSFSFLSFVL